MTSIKPLFSAVVNKRLLALIAVVMVFAYFFPLVTNTGSLQAKGVVGSQANAILNVLRSGLNIDTSTLITKPKQREPQRQSFQFQAEVQQLAQLTQAIPGDKRALRYALFDLSSSLQNNTGDLLLSAAEQATFIQQLANDVTSRFESQPGVSKQYAYWRSLRRDILATLDLQRGRIFSTASGGDVTQ